MTMMRMIADQGNTESEGEGRGLDAHARRCQPVLWEDQRKGETEHGAGEEHREISARR